MLSCSVPLQTLLFMSMCAVRHIVQEPRMQFCPKPPRATALFSLILFYFFHRSPIFQKRLENFCFINLVNVFVFVHILYSHLYMYINLIPRWDSIKLKAKTDYCINPTPPCLIRSEFLKLFLFSAFPQGLTNYLRKGSKFTDFLPLIFASK